MAGLIQVLVNYEVAAMLHALAIIRILLILRNMFKYNIKSSQFLVALLINWLVLCILILPLEVFGVISWLMDTDATGIRNGFVMFALGMPPHVFGLALIPVTVFYLTLERIFIIRFQVHYGSRHKKYLRVAYLCTLALGICVVAFGFYKAFLLVTPLMPCVVNGCILGQYVLIYLGWRAVCALFNFSFGTAFFVMLYKTYRKHSPSVTNEGTKQTNRANNFLALLAIATEFCLGFVPHFFPFVWEEINGPGSSMWTGPLSEIASSIDVLIFTTTYASLFSPARFQRTTVVHRTNTMWSTRRSSNRMAASSNQVQPAQQQQQQPALPNMAISPVNVVNIIESAAAAAAQNDGSMPIATISNTVPTQRASMAMRGRSPTAALMAHAASFAVHHRPPYGSVFPAPSNNQSHGGPGSGGGGATSTRQSPN